MSQNETTTRAALLRGLAAVVCFALLLAVLALWLGTSGVYCRRLRGPSLVVWTPESEWRAAAGMEGLLFRYRRFRTNRALSVRFEYAGRLSSRWYCHGFVVSALGFTLAVLARSCTDIDLIIPPHVALVIPYWFAVSAFGVGFLWLSGLGRWLFVSRRFSRLSWWLMGFTMFVFVALSCVPYAGGRGGRIQPDTVGGWLRLVFWPSAHSEIFLRYGFPFICYRRGIINGKSVSFYHGCDNLGLIQHRLMEDLCIALAACLAVGALASTRREPGPAKAETRPRGSPD